MTRARILSPGRIVALLVGAALAPVASCAPDPTHDAEVTALGDEVPGVPAGPYHRPGQPCTVCHGGLGPASTQFAMAGTVFDSKTTAVGVDHAQILLVDAIGSSPTAPIYTNCVGNFYVTPDVWSPSFPVLAGIQAGPTTTQMFTQISRATSCAECHTDPPSTEGTGHVYVDVSINPNKARQCPYSPNAATGDGGGL